MNINLLTYDSIDSTNTEALKQARLGADEGLCIVARQQTAGRGRHGRTWVSEKDAGLYFSIVLRPKIETNYLPLITLMTGVAVHDTLEEFGIDADIKWVNDILVNEKKIAGILAETVESPSGLAVVVGIGINIRSTNFPAEIAETATSIEEHLSARETPANNSLPSLTNLEPAGLSQVLTKYLGDFYAILQRERGPTEVIDHWRIRSSYFTGKPVRVLADGNVVLGITDGLDPNGALRIKASDGSLKVIQAGDVERLREDDLGRREMHAN